MEELRMADCQTDNDDKKNHTYTMQIMLILAATVAMAKP